MKGNKRKQEDKEKRLIFLEGIELIGSVNGVTKISAIVSAIFDNRIHPEDATEEDLDKEKKRLTNTFYSIKNNRSVPYDALTQEMLNAFDSEELYNLLSKSFNLEREGAKPIEEEIKGSIPKLIERIDSLKKSIAQKEAEYNELTLKNEELINLVVQLGKEDKDDKELKEVIEALKKYREN